MKSRFAIGLTLVSVFLSGLMLGRVLEINHSVDEYWRGWHQGKLDEVVGSKETETDGPND